MLGLAHLPGYARAASSGAGTVASSASWGDLARSLKGPLLQKEAPGYAKIAAPWNLRFAARLPAGIARCASPEDVRTCLHWAQSNDVPLAIRSGGHSYAGFSTTSGLMIDVSLMNEVGGLDASGRVRLSGGARNANVYAALRPLGRAITHGRCKGVGVAGLVLGGGIGFSQRLRGLACDQLVETEIVIASGESLRCNAEENADLFWACRGGGGGNFGVNTSLTFQTFPVAEVTVFRLVWSSGLDELLPAALDLLPTTPDQLGCKLFVEAGKDEQLELIGQLVATEGELTSLLAPLYRVATPNQLAVRALPYWDSQEFLSEEGPPEYSHERSRYIFRPLPPEGARTILDFLRRWPTTHDGAQWKIFLAGGAVAAVPTDATAFVHRKALMLSTIDLSWTPEDDEAAVRANQVWLDEFYAAMRPFTSDESFQNFIDEAETNYLRAYYGANLERLVEIKRKYDPDNLFRFPQSIPLSL
ncbi:MAG TPA: FAD-binding oxidoreductase [Methyloceanibacter sp.]|nr:FAD-binding oxidoreductase [Methyloceanibacter sp.]